MHEAETRALRNATVLLLVVSVARWGWSTRGPAIEVEDDASVLGELLDASKEAADEQTRRTAALADGERIDPNRADEVDLDRLPGIGPSAARAIVSAREDGAVFRSPEDLLAVRGIGPSTLDRIRASLDLAAPPAPRRARGTTTRLASAPPRVDLNRAELAELQTLPGIGPAIAERILVARREQVFTSVDDLIRVRGIGPATVERLRPRATLGPGP